MSYLLGIDIGTSSAKAVLFDPEAAAIGAAAGHEYPIHKPMPDRAEQDPEDWWQATITSVRSALAQVEKPEVIAISFSGQMHGGVFLGRDAHPLAPAIIWADQRSVESSAELADLLGKERFTSIAGTLPAVGFLGPTLLWLKQHESDLFDKLHQFILPKDYVRLRLTGEIATDISDASATALFDIQRRDWSDEILKAAGLSRAICPPLRASTAIAGFLTREAADALGLPPGLPVATGCADQPAQAIGNGLIAPGMASITIGSGGQVFNPLQPINGRVKSDPRLHVFNHAVPDTWYILGAMLSAGLSLRWLRHLTGLEGRDDAYSILSGEATAVPPGADGLIFLPYLSGERTPHMDALARGSFIGLSYHHERGHLARAVMEGVAFALREILEISFSLGGQAKHIIAAGGGTESDVWRQILADVLGLPLQQTLLKEQASVGAALVAGVASGVYKTTNEACYRTVRHGTITTPDMSNHVLYDDLYAKFVELYPRLRDNFHWLSRFSQP